jgi:hypothetical protein
MTGKLKRMSRFISLSTFPLDFIFYCPLKVTGKPFDCKNECKKGPRKLGPLLDLEQYSYDFIVLTGPNGPL